MDTLAHLRAEAERIAAALPPFQHGAGLKATSRSGTAPRQQAGQGEDFWQYRAQTPDDDASTIDWRRSATGDELFIREHELQSARLLSLWVSGSAGFDWKSSKARTTKADRAREILSAIAIRYCETGDHAVVLGSEMPPTSISHAPGRLIDALMQSGDADAPPPARTDTAHIILADDFYGDLSAIKDWIFREADEGRTGLLLQVSDPLEIEFPFSGRVKFRVPGMNLERIFGRTELLKAEYDEKFQERQAELADLTKGLGWSYLSHNTADDALPIAFQVMQYLGAEAMAA